MPRIPGSPNQLRRLKPVQIGHVNVQQDHGEILFEQTTQSLVARPGFHELVVQVRQEFPERQEIRGQIIDEQDVCLLPRR